MKLRLLNCLALVPLLLFTSCGKAAETNTVTAELNDLIGKINAKLSKGTNTESGLAPEIKQFDALVEKHKAEKTDQVAEILFMKAQLYLEVLRDTPEPALEAIKQIKRDFPQTKLGKAADDILPQVEGLVAAAKIRRTLIPGTKFPAFAEKDSTGQPLVLTNYHGKVVLVDFWATWCPPCLADLPNLIKIYQAYRPKGFEIIGVDLDDDPQRLARFLKEKDVTWPQYYDGKVWQSKLAVKYGVVKTPTSYLLDKQGIIVTNDVHGPALEAAVAQALAKK